ncbi:MAG: hypothetical protein ACOYJL_07360 [Tractidigestivibacter sp.]
MTRTLRFLSSLGSWSALLMVRETFCVRMMFPLGSVRSEKALTSAGVAQRALPRSSPLL